MSSLVVGLFEAFGAARLFRLSNEFPAVDEDASESFTAEKIKFWSSARAGVDLDV
tara:strand:+ start:188 stop:352 length:165 start_codon:yes stop_codon:yes gene_type:complete